MNMNAMKKLMMAGAVCVALCGSSFAGANQKMVAHNDKHQVQQHQVQQKQVLQKKQAQQKKQQAHQQKHVVKQKQVVVHKDRYHDHRYWCPPPPSPPRIIYVYR